MILSKLKCAPIILIEDDLSKNILPMLLELTALDKNTINFICYEQPIALWKQIYKDKYNVYYHKDLTPSLVDKFISDKSYVIIDSVNQMALSLGWNQSLHYLKKLYTSSKIPQIIVVLHVDCLLPHSQLQLHLHHLASAIVTYDQTDALKVRVQLKKNGKLIQSEELLSYDSKTSTLKSTHVVKEEVADDEPLKPIPENLSTFKIEVDQTDKIEKYKLKLPYMSKIHEGESKVYYEPDAVDDWDEEDPDEDLDI